MTDSRQKILERVRFAVARALKRLEPKVRSQVAPDAQREILLITAEEIERFAGFAYVTIEGQAFVPRNSLTRRAFELRKIAEEL